MIILVQILLLVAMILSVLVWVTDNKIVHRLFLPVTGALGFSCTVLLIQVFIGS